MYLWKSCTFIWNFIVLFIYRQYVMNVNNSKVFIAVIQCLKKKKLHLLNRYSFIDCSEWLSLLNLFSLFFLLFLVSTSLFLFLCFFFFVNVWVKENELCLEPPLKIKKNRTSNISITSENWVQHQNPPGVRFYSK